MDGIRTGCCVSIQNFMGRDYNGRSLAAALLREGLDYAECALTPVAGLMEEEFTDFRASLDIGRIETIDLGNAFGAQSRWKS